MSDFEQDMINDFVEEANELLASIEDDFILLEKKLDNPDIELVNKIFRAIHTIKGTSGFLGLKNIGKITHIMEAVMSNIRKGILKPESSHIDTLLAGADLLKKMTNNILESNEININPIYDRLSNILNETESQNQFHVEVENKENFLNNNFQHVESQINLDSTIKKLSEINIDKNIITEFVADAKKIISEAEKDFKLLKSKLPESDFSIINKIYRAIDTFKSTSNLLNLHNLSKIAELINILLLQLRNHQIVIEQYHFEIIFKAIDKINVMLDDIMYCNDLDISDLVYEFNSIIKNINSNEKPIIEQQHIERDLSQIEDNIEKNINAVNAQIEKNDVVVIKPPETSNTIRIHINILDKLMRLAGELVLVRNQQIINYHQSGGINRGIIQKLDKVTTELQETIIQTRLQPIASLFGKFPRIIRELNRKLNKEIILKLNGSEVEMDKTVLELLAGPLTHLIRNAGDHGIETVEERKKYGKPARGKIELNAYHEGSFVIIEVKDDGKGINPELIKKSALRLGMKTESEMLKMNDAEVLSLVLLPGFTTAKQISDISGRGVGMDVVKESIEKVNGTIEIQSKIGVGTSIFLKVPLTLSIIQCLVITTQGNYYAIPQINLEELITLYDEDIDNHIENTGEQEVFMLRDTLLPIVRLNEIFKHPKKFNKKTKRDILEKYSQNNRFHDLDFSPDNNLYSSSKTNREMHFAVLKFGKHKYGLVFDQIVGTEEIVVKPMHPLVKTIKIYSGATIMGNGKVALILDVENIALHGAIDFNLSDTFANQSKNKYKIEEKESILLFKVGSEEQYALALPLVKRVDQIKLSEIQKAGNEEFFIKGNVSIKIIRLDTFINVSACVENETMYLILPKFCQNPIGILVSKIIDIKNVQININTTTYISKGVMGTDIIGNKLTLFLDLFKIIELADPTYKISTDNVAKPGIPNIEIKILLVEDSSYMRQLIKGYLLEAGYVVETASDGVMALEKLAEQKFDLLVSDLEMPNMNGFNLISNVRKGNIQSEIPAIANSSLNSPEIIEKALQSGFNKYIVKIQKEKLLSAVSEIIQDSLNN